jgi:hypothetical protein
MVKPHWDTEELVENWTLLPQELELVNKKIGEASDWFCHFTKIFSTNGSFS